MDADSLRELKQELVRTWSRHGEADRAEPVAGPRFQNLEREGPRPRAGLAIGHVRDKASGAVRLEFRVTAAAGPNFAFAQSLAAAARAKGVESNVRTVSRPAAVRPAAESAPYQAERVRRARPLVLGQSIGHESGGAGSIGLFVRTPSGEDAVLSCTHVLARRGSANATIGDDVHSPGPLDQDPMLPTNRVGKLTPLFAPFVARQLNNLDAAVAAITPGGDIGPLRNAFPDRADIPADCRGKPLGARLAVDDIELGDPVVKYGRTTGFTDNAVVRAFDFQNLSVEFAGGESFTFSSAIELEWLGDVPFTRPGDSGSLVVRKRDLRPLGLHFAASEGDRLSYVMPLERICATFTGLEVL